VAGSDPSTNRDIPKRSSLVGELSLVAIAGAVHVRIDNGAHQHHVPLETVKIGHRANRGGRGRPHRFFIECRVPDDPRVSERYRGCTVRTRLDTTDDDIARGLNRAENLRPIAQAHQNWEIIGGQRSRAESLNSRVKHRWANGRLNAVGVPRQTLRLLGIALAINRDAAMAYEQRTGRPPGDPPLLQHAA
jgi:hypothetical protein